MTLHSKIRKSISVFKLWLRQLKFCVDSLALDMQNTVFVSPTREGKQKGLPTKAYPRDSGFDVYNYSDKGSYWLSPNETIRLSTGLIVDYIPKGLELQARTKSGLASKHGIFVLNSPGTVDNGYRGELEVILHNVNTFPFVLEEGKKIAQVVPAHTPSYRGVGLLRAIREFFRPVTFSWSDSPDGVRYLNPVKENQSTEHERQDNGFGSTGL